MLSSFDTSKVYHLIYMMLLPPSSDAHDRRYLAGLFAKTLLCVRLTKMLGV